MKVVDRLLEALPVGVAGSAFCKPRTVGRNVIGRPVMLGPRRGVGIITEKDQAVGLCRSTGPVERRGKIFTIASEASRDRRIVRKGT